MAETEFNVYIEDQDGNVIIQEIIKSLPNGFIDLWLPRDKEYFVRIEYEDRISEFKISTSLEDRTCITTAQLLPKHE